MSKKMKVLVSVLVAILVLAIGGTTMALAQEDEDAEPQDEELTTEVAPNGFLTRVAEILGIPEEELREAFEQAKKETREERFERVFYQMLDKAVEAEILAPEEAEEIKEWWEEKPEALTSGLLQRAFWAMHPHPYPKPLLRGSGNGRSEMKLHLQQRLKRLPSPEMRPEILEKALEQGLISREKIDEIKEWLESKPEVSNSLSSPARVLKAMRGRQMTAVPKGWQGQITDEIAD